ncbi:MAG: GIY-YIG nuclease family protein [Flavobacteriales bacterium]|jgi:putative endonuclease
MKDVGCYILWSDNIKKFYVGVCHENLNQRIIAHNQHVYGKKSYSSITKDWALFLFIKTEDFSHAVRVERKIKSMKSKIFIQNLLKYPELISKILAETK